MKNENGRQTIFIIPLRYSSTARDGRASATLTSKERRKGDSSPCAITRAFGVLVDVQMCDPVCVCVCVRVHLPARV